MTKVLEGEVLVASRTRPLQTTAQILSLAPGSSIKDAVLAAVDGDINLYNGAYVTLNGEVIEGESWHIKPADGDLLTVTCPPGDSGILRFIAFAGLAIAVPHVAPALAPGLSAAATASGASFGAIAAYSAFQGGLYLFGSLLINSLIPPPKPDRPSQDPSFPYLSGVGNKARIFEVVPRVFGKHRMVADAAATPYTELIDDDEQYLTALLCWGYGPVKLSNIRFGDVPIRHYGEDELQIEHMGVFSEDELALDTTWSIISTLYPLDVHQEAIESTVRHGFPVIRSSGSAAKRVDITYGFPSGLISYTDSGRKRRYEVEVRIERSKVTVHENGTRTIGSWETVKSEVIRKKTRSPVRLVHLDIIDEADEADNVFFNYRMTRVSEEPDPEDTIQSNLVWHHIRTHQTGAPTNFLRGSYTAIRVRASSRFRNTLPELNADVEAYIPALNKSTGEWDRLRISDNPADCVYEVLRSVATARDVPEDQINKEVLRDFWDECADKGYRFNYIVRGTNGIWDLLQDICRVGFASPGRPNSKWGVVMDRAQTVPVQIFTPRNTRNYNLQKTFDRVPHAVRVKFPNVGQDYRPDEVVYYRPGYTEVTASEYVSIQVNGVTDAEHAWKVARFYLAQKIVRPEVHTFEAFIDYLTCERGSLVRMQQDTIAVGNVSGRVVSIGKSDSIKVDCQCPFIGGRAFSIRVRTNGNKQLVFGVTPIGLPDTLQDGQEGLTDELMLSGNASGISPGDLFAFGETTRETLPLVVTDIRPSNETTATLECVAYDDDLYNLTSIPTFDSYVSSPLLLDRARSFPTYYTDQGQSDATVQRNPDGSVAAKIIVVIVPITDQSAIYANIEGIEFRYRKFAKNVEDLDAWEKLEVTASAEQAIIGGVDAPSTVAQRDVLRAALRTGSAPSNLDDLEIYEDFTYCIQGRYVRGPGSREGVGPWGPVIYHTVLGPPFRPPIPQNLRRTSENRFLEWDVGTEIVENLVGYLIKYQLGDEESSDYEGATNALGGNNYFPNSFFDLTWLPKQKLTVFVKSLNSLGFESERYASLFFDNSAASIGEDGTGIEFIYTLTNSETQIDAPTQTPAQKATNQYVPPGWSASFQAPTSTNKVAWVSFRTGTTGNWGDFSLPSIFTKFAEGGRDGFTVEYVFQRTATLTRPTTPTTTVSEDGRDGFVPSGWTANPQGVTTSLPYEWVSIRRGSPGNWDKFRDATVFAAMGAPGEDGKSVEFIFKVTSSDERPDTPDSVNEDDHVPAGWTDDPKGPDPINRWEWVCSRIRPTGGIWGSYSTAGLWSTFPEDGEDGKSIEYVYRRTTSNIKPATPDSVDEDDYKPTGWTDNPLGVDATNTHEWIAPRAKVGGKWGDYSEPALWSVYVVGELPSAPARSNDILSRPNFRHFYTAPANVTVGPGTYTLISFKWSQTGKGAGYGACIMPYAQGPWQADVRDLARSAFSSEADTTKSDPIFLFGYWLGRDLYLAKDRGVNIGAASFRRAAIIDTVGDGGSGGGSPSPGTPGTPSPAPGPPGPVGSTIITPDYVYILSSSQPATPTGGTSDQHHIPTGWSRSQPVATTSQGVWRSARNITFDNNVFRSATAWGVPTQLNAAVGLAAPTGLRSTTNPFTVYWNAVPDATSYEVKWALTRDDVVASDAPAWDNIMGTSLTSSTISSGRWWAVRAVNASGPGPWSDPSQMQAVPGSGASIPTPTDLQVTPTGIIAANTNTAYYATFQYSSGSSFPSGSTTTLYDTYLSGVHAVVFTPPSGTIYVRARFTTGSRDSGSRGSWSSTVTYTRSSTPTPPTLSAPTGLVSTISGAYIEWNNVSGATSYEVRYDVSRSRVLARTTLSFTGIIPSATAKTRYYSVLFSMSGIWWQVRARSSSAVSAWSVVQQIGP